MSEKILFVDDDVKLLNGIRRQLEDDFDVVTAELPSKALELIQTEGPFAIVVSDMCMPEMSGTELLAQVAKQYPDTVRVMLTGQADTQKTKAAIEHGYIGQLLSKPCNADKLIEVVEEAIRKYQKD